MMQRHIDFFSGLLKEYCYIDDDTLYAYSHDQTEDISVLPFVVLKPNTVEQLSKILSYCNKHLIAITPIGARTGLSGGAIPTTQGVALSMERFDKIINIDEKNHQVTVEPGVITEFLQKTLQERGLFYPPDPASKGSCFIGGNVAENSGGPKAVKYGVTKDYVLNIEIVLPNGEVMWTGANVLKNATGYNLTQLIVGSEGTLAVISKIVLKLLPHPTCDMLLFVPFGSAKEACQAVSRIYQSGVVPSALELMEKDAVLLTQQYLKKNNQDLFISIKDNHQAHLLIEVDGFKNEQLTEDIERILSVLETFDSFDSNEVLLATSQQQKDQLWLLRRRVGEAVKSFSVYKEEDTVVPRYALPDLLKKVKALEKKYHFRSVCYGHAGDGNLHINILKDEMSEQQWKENLPIAISELFLKVVELGGTLSGEHGIGLVQKQYMNIAFKPIAMNLMREIKKVFDPNNILNPNKILPEI